MLLVEHLFLFGLNESNVLQVFVGDFQDAVGGVDG